MLRHNLYFLSLLTLLSNCASLPTLPDAEDILVADVVDAVQCELQGAERLLSSQYKFLRSWGIGLGFTLVVEEKSGFSPDLISVIPIVRSFNPLDGTKLLGGSATIGIHADINKTSRRTVNFKLAFGFKDLDKYQCNHRNKSSHPIASNLGVYEWLGDALQAVSSKDVVGDPLSIGTTIEFIAFAEGRLSPSVSLTRVRGPGKLDPSAIINSSRSDHHTVDFTFAPLPAPSKPIEVVIVRRK